MAELATRQGEDESVHGLNREREPLATAPSGRRITADSFRLLTARLKKSSDASQAAIREQIAQQQPQAIEPAPLEEPAPTVISVDFSPPDPEPEAQPAPQAPPIEVQASVKPEPPQPPSGRPQPLAKARAEAHSLALEAIAKLRKAAGVITEPEAEPAVELAPEAALPEADPVSAAEEIAPSAPELMVESRPALRRPHPFFPDVFLDDDEPAQEPPAAVVDEHFEEPVAEMAVQPILEPPPAYAPLYEEGEIEVEQPPLPPAEEIAPAAPVAEAVAAPSADEGAAEQQDGLVEDEAEAVKHLHGVEVVGIGDIARAIFRNPTAEERAAFLADIQALDRAEEDETKEIRAVEIAAEPEKATLRKPKPADDPFARIAEATANAVHDQATDEDAAELARSLLDMMLSSPSAGLPQERALAADALLKLVPRVPAKALVSIVERLSIMENPPHLLIAKLINDPRIEIAGPLLEQCNHISDQLIGKVIETGQISLQRLIARRRHLSAALTDALISFDDPSVILTLVRNSGAVISHQGFHKIAEHAAQHHQVLAPFATRSDLPAPIAFALFWHVPAELRRYLLSRFLTDSETLTKILKITNVMDGGEQGDGAKFAEKDQLDAAIAAVESGDEADAAQRLAGLAGVSEGCAARIISDRGGEPLAIALKAVGANRAQFEEYVERLKASDHAQLDPGKQSLELQSLFDQMSFNKARVLLTYWDWAELKSGPYSSAH
jgi:Uncharacterised protein conserved in bacteria (DUF2336)